MNQNMAAADMDRNCLCAACRNSFTNPGGSQAACIECRDSIDEIALARKSDMKPNEAVLRNTTTSGNVSASLVETEADSGNDHGGNGATPYCYHYNQGIRNRQNLFYHSSTPNMPNANWNPHMGHMTPR